MGNYLYKLRDFNSKKTLKKLMANVKSEFGMPKTQIKKINGNKFNIYFKLEFQNNFGSFKNRVAERLINTAIRNKYTKVFSNTSGNLGLAISRLSKKKKLFSNITINNDKYPKIKLLKVNTSILEYRQTTPSLISRILSYVCSIIGKWDIWWFFFNMQFYKNKTKQGYFIAQPSIYLNPESLLGYSEISWEIFRQLKDSVPDYVITPIVNSDNAIGQWLGYYSLFKERRISKMPCFILVERKKVVKHFNYPDAWLIIKKISKVLTFEVSEKEEMLASFILRKKYGLNIENISAGVWKAVNDLKKTKVIQDYSTTVLIISGSNV